MTKIQVDSLGRAIMLGNNALVASSSSGCFPSGTYETLTLGASGATYTAPADGYFLIYISDPTGTAYGQDTTIGSFTFTISNNTKNGFGSYGDLLITSNGGSVAGCYKSYFPVSADDQISLTYTSGLNCTVHLLFYYTIDSAPAQS